MGAISLRMTEMIMDIDTWRTTRIAVPDLIAEGCELGLVDEPKEPIPGLIYAESLFIEGPNTDGFYHLTLENQQYDGSLETLEAILHDWADHAGYWA